MQEKGSCQSRARQGQDVTPRVKEGSEARVRIDRQYSVAAIGAVGAVSRKEDSEEFGFLDGHSVFPFCCDRNVTPVALAVKRS